MASFVQTIELDSLKRERTELACEWYGSQRRDLALLIRIAYLGQLIQNIEGYDNEPSSVPAA